MNECTEIEINEMLPDMLHQSLAADAVVRLEAHLATCRVCRDDLEILRTVMGASVFTPTINVDRVVRRIPPHQRILPAVESPATYRAMKWLAAAAVAFLVIGSGSVLMVRQKSASAPTERTADSQTSVGTQNPVVIETPPTTGQTRSTSRTTAATHALALAADVDGLSDGNLAQLMNEMTSFDALPASEPEPVISVDSGYNVQQDLR
jgi:hypothetical protein